MPSRRELANAIRALSMDAVQKAKSGHPGAPMGMADIAEVLWNDFLHHNPNNPHWANRDRFVLSNGHGSMLLYSLLHLTGYKVTLDDLKQFRQLHSKTPGHPEYGHTPGVETTTGPLGQGISNAVGMALAEKILAAHFNRDGHEIVNHHTYVFLGDGCMMEGISHESCSLAGTFELGKLIAFYDDNGISIDGHVKGWFTDDTPKRFEAYGWHVIRGVDGHNSESIRQATLEAQSVTNKPTLICCKTIIGFGSPHLAGTHDCHGSPLGDAEIAATREKLGWHYPPFEIPSEIYDNWNAIEKGTAAEKAWNEKFSAYKSSYPDLAAEFERRLAKKLPENWEEKVMETIFAADTKAEKVATRKASQNAIEAYAHILPELLGGSADLTGSNLTNWSGSKEITRSDDTGNYIHYGVREFGMSTIINGISVHGGFIPYGGTFLMFSDYARNGIRVAALMRAQSIFVYTHDSIGLGEDGPTHQAVEQAATLRYIPHMSVWRPCDTVETLVAWKTAIEHTNGPTALLLSRQGLPCQKRTPEQIKSISRGGYILRDCEGTPNLIIIATGSEVELAEKAFESLSNSGIKTRVVSMPSTDAFDNQDESYRESVLPTKVKARIAVEAGIPDYWRKYVGLEGKVLGVDTFGESAPAEQVYKYFGLTVENLITVAKSLVS
ncbi:transketolase [Candidatus Nitrosacidococcus tergens]|uniref:Transketolase n=1 Tax=Candidatus Nitrosacidococcus tergens TaxID=553981 RepID=A0A7G1Q7R5_9GAMM|nr:transketolase [Candidatus Nitrosacidococcus tergens]CAB1274518.1 transketolase 1, thiamin-binding [Candidatus Nitrosacidococcus tergens]